MVTSKTGGVTQSAQSTVLENADVAAALGRLEPQCCKGQPDIVWQHAEGATVVDIEGRSYIDCSSGIMVANVGHAHPAIISAIVAAAQTGPLHAYGYPTTARLDFLRALKDFFPEWDCKILLRTTGAEAIEAAIKLVRKYFFVRGQADKNVVVGYQNGFHGRTMAAQLTTRADPEWVPGVSAGYIQVDFPDGYYSGVSSFPQTEAQIAAQVPPDRVAAVVIEPFQGGTGCFASSTYLHQLANWCRAFNIKLVFDEIQSGFGRTGDMFAFQHAGVQPDLLALGKGLSGGLPVSALIGNSDIMDSARPKEMGSTHAANPVCLAGALANIKLFRDGTVVETGRKRGQHLQQGFRRIRELHANTLAAAFGRGMVVAAPVVHHGRPSAAKALALVNALWKRGVFTYTPIGPHAATLKLTPPLTISAEQVDSVLDSLESALEQIAHEWEQ